MNPLIQSPNFKSTYTSRRLTCADFSLLVITLICIDPQQQSEMSAYVDIEERLRTNNSLISCIENLHHSLAPSRKLRTRNLNDQQIITQIYTHLNGQMAKLRRKIDEQQQSQLASGKVQSHISGQHSQQEEQQPGNAELSYDQQDFEGAEPSQEVSDANQQQFIENEINQSQQSQQQSEQEDELDSASEEDVGLYGEQIDEQDMQSYENEEMNDPEFDNNFADPKYGDSQQEVDAQDEQIEENFDHFRNLERQNQADHEKKEEIEKSSLEQQIDRLEDKVFSQKEWTLQGEVKAKERPFDSLLEQNLQFKTNLKMIDLTQAYNSDLESMIKQRVRDELFDDRVRYASVGALQENFGKKPLADVSTEKSNKGLGELYEAEFKNYLGLGEKKDHQLRQQIMQGFKQLNYHLDSLSNLNFTPKPSSSTSHKDIGIVAEERVPTTNWGIQEQEVSDRKVGKTDFEGKDEIDHKVKRLKKKRISRQRKKEQMRNQLNRKIAYGGLTKAEAVAHQKIKTNTRSKTNGKFNKSNQFFKSISQKPKGKPNPNLSKMKI